uniref:Zinc finger CCHC domain-containing protein 7 n=2 Tax=Cacopsylla melanoneura TaxID=428564 RepID=A0A8D8Q7X7_9HEMI
MEITDCQLAKNNVINLIKTENISRYQKLSTLMYTDYWVPPKDTLREIHELYLNCKHKSNVKHWLNELRLIYNACDTLFDEILDKDHAVFITLYFIYPIEFKDTILLSTWFFDVLQLVCNKEKINPTFKAELFFEKMFETDMNKCIKYTFLDNEKNLISMNMVTGKQLTEYGQVELFWKISKCLSTDNQFQSFLKLVHLYLSYNLFSPRNDLFVKSFMSSKNKPSTNVDFYKDFSHKICHHFTKFMYNKDNLYKIFQTCINDYLVCIPIGSEITQLYVKCDKLEKTTMSNDINKVHAIDLISKSDFVQHHPEYLENLNMYNYMSQYQTSTTLMQEMKYLYYKFRKIDEFASASDVMLQKSIEDFSLENKEYHLMVFQQWLVQKMQILYKQNLNLFYYFENALHVSLEKLVLESYILKNLPDPKQKDFLLKFLKLETHQYHDRCFMILLSIFVCFAEYQNIVVEKASTNDREDNDHPPFSEDSIQIGYRNERVRLNEDDQKVWNMLFNQCELHITQLNTWVYKKIKQACENSNQNKVSFDSENSNQNQVSFDPRISRIVIFVIEAYLEFLSKYHSSYLTLHVGRTQNPSSGDNGKRKASVDEISEQFVKKIKLIEKQITGKNVQLVLNIVNYVNCFLGIRKFRFLQPGNEFCIEQDKTFDIIDTNCTMNGNMVIKSKVNQSLHGETCTKNMNSHVVQTEAIIEHCEPDNTRKRSLKSSLDENEATNRKKTRLDQQDSNNTEHDIINIPSRSKPQPDLDMIVNESQVANSKVSVFEDQFKRKLNSLSKEYSELITKITIKKEDDPKSKGKTKPVASKPIVSVSTDNGDSYNASGDESDVVVLGPGPPKQVDVITLNENGEEIKDNADDNSDSDRSKDFDNEEENSTDTTNNKVDETNENIGNSKNTIHVQNKAKETEENKTIQEQNQIEEEEDEKGEICLYPKKWSKEMVDFYTEDINADHFKQRIQSQVYRSSANQWRVDYHNSYRYTDSQYGYNKMCENCGSRLHDCKSCPKPCSSVCPMCGETGHSPDRCPDAQCLNCGKKTDEYLFNCEECDEKVVLQIRCEVCNRLYHTSDDCPHLWRCMEFTTRKGKLKLVPSNVTNNYVKYCSNCAVRGHLLEECPHLSSENPLRQDSSWKVLSEAHAAYLVTYKLRVSRHMSKVLLSKQGMSILQNLSNQSGVNIEYLVDEGVNLLTYKANPCQSHFIRSQLKKILFGS